jgi:hypothetical protein
MTASERSRHHDLDPPDLTAASAANRSALRLEAERHDARRIDGHVHPALGVVNWPEPLAQMPPLPLKVTYVAVAVV